jgi:hypothetical protein
MLAHLCLTNLYSQVKYSVLINHGKYAPVFIPYNTLQTGLIFVTDARYKEARVLVPDKPLQPGLIFKAYSCNNYVTRDCT